MKLTRLINDKQKNILTSVHKWSFVVLKYYRKLCYIWLYLYHRAIEIKVSEEKTIVQI